MVKMEVDYDAYKINFLLSPCIECPNGHPYFVGEVSKLNVCNLFVTFVCTAVWPANAADKLCNMWFCYWWYKP